MNPKKILTWLKQEFFSVFPAFVYFLIVFNILNFSENLFLKKHHLSTQFDFISIFFVAAIIAKILIVINHLPFINLFPKKPLIFNILWKTFLYELSCIIVRFMILVFPYFVWINPLSSFMSALTYIDLNTFLAVQIWYLIFFFFFVVIQELFNRLGKKHFLQLFFGRFDT
jgi:hypothetical protein